jgi:diguanylate cyclase (GGDEF)-like protein
MGSQGLHAPAEPRFALLRTGRIRPRPPGWLIFLAVGLGLAVAAALVGDLTFGRPWQAALGLATSAAILVGLRMHHPARRAGWQLLAAGNGLTTVGTMFTATGANPAAFGLIVTAAGSIASLGGFVLLIRGRIPGGDRAAFLDAAILAAGGGVLIWALGFGPYILAAHESSLVTVIFFYPAVIALAMVARLWSLEGAHRPATRLLVLVVLAPNGILILDLLQGYVGKGSMTGLSQLASFAELAFMGAAALHPSMAIVPERRNGDLEPVGRRRILALSVALLVNPATLSIQVWAGQAIDPAPYVVGGTLIGLLVIRRLSDALGQLGQSLRERESLMERLRHQALYDGLTSLPNRTLLTERLTAEYARYSRERALAVLLLDLDDFKAVNDTYGHKTGDALLVAVGRRLGEAIRDGDTAARLGGDEFVIALPGLGAQAVAMAIAERVLVTLNAPFDIGGHRLHVRASIGLAMAGVDDEDADDLIRNADIAMYIAKSRGKCRIEVFEPSMHLAAVANLASLIA